MSRNWRPYTLGALCRGTGCTPLEPALDVITKGQSQLLNSSTREAVNIEPERVKLKNLHC
jgi:hypothetical protein